MIITCPHCQADIDIEGKLFGERVHHAPCQNWSLIRYGVTVQPPRTQSERQRVAQCDMAVLIERARHARHDITVVQNDIRMTIAETRRIIAAARPEAVYAPAAREPSIATDDVTDL